MPLNKAEQNKKGGGGGDGIGKREKWPKKVVV